MTADNQDGKSPCPPPAPRTTENRCIPPARKGLLQHQGAVFAFKNRRSDFMSASTCRICGLLYVPSLEEDRKTHAARHKKLARGSQPQMVRDFSKAFGWAVAFNDGGLDRLKTDYDPELGKLVVVYSWWSRALANGVPEKDFDLYMNAHLTFADSLVSSVGEAEARTGIKKWEQYAG